VWGAESNCLNDSAGKMGAMMGSSKLKSASSTAHTFADMFPAVGVIIGFIFGMPPIIHCREQAF
jgi:hypothetical protein